VTDTLGGHANLILHTSKGENVAEYLTSLAEQIEADENITVHMSTAIEDVDGFIGNFKTKLSADGSEVKHGAALIAIGRERIQAHEYLYGKDKRVLTSLDMDDLLMRGRAGPEKGQDVRLYPVRGVPQRRNGPTVQQGVLHPYRGQCPGNQENQSRRQGLRPLPGYADLWRTRDLYKEAREQGVICSSATTWKPAQGGQGGQGKLELKTVRSDPGRDVIINPDYLVLATAIREQP
jgi:hypothetical protein